MDSILSFLGLIRKAGFLETGEENTGLSVKNGKCKVILLACDASDNARRRAERFAGTGKGIPILRLPHTKLELSMATGRAGCSMAAVNDIGFASAIAQKLCKLELQSNIDAAQLLKSRRDKAVRRRTKGKTPENNDGFRQKDNESGGGSGGKSRRSKA